jgi:hypothetical protein
MGNAPKNVEKLHIFCSFVLGLFNVYVIVLIIVYIGKGLSPSLIYISIISIAISISLSSLLYGGVRELVTSLPQYVFLIGCNSIVFPTFSICNVHQTCTINQKKLFAAESLIASSLDLLAHSMSEEQLRARLKFIQNSSKQDRTKTDSVQLKFDQFRSLLVILWLLTNILLPLIILQISNFSTGFLQFSFGLPASIFVLQGLGAIIYFAGMHDS